MKMELIKTGLNVVDCINSVLKQKNCIKLSCDEWIDVYELSKKHQVDSIISTAVQTDENIPVEIKKLFAHSLDQAILIDTQQQFEYQQLFDLLNKEKVAFAPLKGYVMKQLYPSSYMRTMSDLDLLIKNEDTNIFRELLKSNGYAVVSTNIEEDAFVKNNILIEVHRILVGEEYKWMYQYYKNSWELVVKQCNYQYQMTNENFYIYHIAHLAKHYMHAGIGIRFILDAYIIAEKYTHMNWEYINNELEKLKLNKFHNNLICIINKWFTGEKIIDKVIIDMEKYIFGSGVYGNIENEEITQYEKYKGMKKIIHYKDVIFPSLKIMSASYPVVEKEPWLMPIFWVVRIINKLRNPYVAINVLKGKKNDDVHKSNEIIGHLNEVGLI